MLLTGGDPLMLRTPVLRQFLTALRERDCVRIIRFGTRANALMKVGVEMANQITPYYLFQCRPVQGSRHVLVPLHETWSIVSEATRDVNGRAKRVKLVISHSSGKIEVLGTGSISGQRHIYLKYHEARDSALTGRISCYPLPDDAYWPDDLRGFEA